jgi:predicted TIM-barrel fold metal-dependent hydrolase
MSNQHIEVDVIDTHWPKLKIIVSHMGRVREVDAQYDIAGTQFVPAVQGALQQAIDAVIKSRKH